MEMNFPEMFQIVDFILKMGSHVHSFPHQGLVGFMVFNATFNNISAISCRSVLLVEETGGPGENYRVATSH
jgi:hypothetical protein